MSYNLHITKKESWVDEEGDIITAKEFEDCIKEDKEIEKIAEGEYLWKAASDFNLEDVFFLLEEGGIRTKNPEQPTVVKMYHIAQKLGAKVQGDDDEIYNEDGEVLPEE